MIREDYIMRMIEQIGVLVRRLLKQSNLTEDCVEADLEALTQQWIGLPADMLLSLPVNHVHQLFVDSDRLIVEKSYLMGEVYRVKGLGAESLEAKIEHFEKALFFFGKCADVGNPNLQEEVNQRMNELTAAVEGNPGLLLTNILDESQNLSYPQPSVERPIADNRKAKRNGAIFWYAIVASFAIAATYSFFLSHNDIEVVDRVWEFQGSTANTRFRIVNNSNGERLVLLKLSVENYSNQSFNSGYTFLGSIKREYRIEPNSSKSIDERFDHSRNMSGPNRLISIEVLSSKLMEGS